MYHTAQGLPRSALRKSARAPTLALRVFQGEQKEAKAMKDAKQYNMGMKEIDTGLRMVVVGVIEVYKGLARVIPEARHPAMTKWKNDFWENALAPFVLTVCRAVGIPSNRFGF